MYGHPECVICTCYSYNGCVQGCNATRCTSFLEWQCPYRSKTLQAASVPSCMFACFSSCVYRNYRQPPGAGDYVLMSEMHLFLIYEVAFNVRAVPCYSSTLQHPHFLHLSAHLHMTTFFLPHCSTKCCIHKLCTSRAAVCEIVQHTVSLRSLNGLACLNSASWLNSSAVNSMPWL